MLSKVQNTRAVWNSILPSYSYYSVIQQLTEAKFAHGGSIFSSSHFSFLLKLYQNLTTAKNDSKTKNRETDYKWCLTVFYRSGFRIVVPNGVNGRKVTAEAFRQNRQRQQWRDSTQRPQLQRLPTFSWMIKVEKNIFLVLT